MKWFCLLIGIPVSVVVSLFVVGGLVTLFGVSDLSYYPYRVMMVIGVVGLGVAWIFSLRFLMHCLSGLCLGVFLTYLVIMLTWPGMNYEEGLNYLFISGLLGVVLGGMSASRRIPLWRKP